MRTAQGEIKVKNETKFLQQIQCMQIVKNLVEAGVCFLLLVGRDLLMKTDVLVLHGKALLGFEMKG